MLSTTAHRPYALPSGKWQYYQEWNDAVFLHWQIPFNLLRECVPHHLALDSFEGHCYVSLVAFTMQKIRPRYLPAVSFISDFDEINLRTYVSHGGKQGVYFLNIEGAKPLSVAIARYLSGLPYENAGIRRSEGIYKSVNPIKNFHLDLEFTIRKPVPEKTPLVTWLTERYCLYVEQRNALYRYDIHHEEWEINAMDIHQLKLCYQIAGINLSETPPRLVHYSKGIKVVAWRRQRI